MASRSRATSRATRPIARRPCICLRAMPGDQSRRFPVIYLLHGYGGREDTFTERLASLQQSSDTLAAAQGFSSAIVVTPSAYTLHKGSMYSNSPTTGDWETIHRRGSRRLHGQPLPHARQPHEPRTGRSLDGRLRRASDRHEAAGRVLQPLSHELVLPDGESQSASGVDGGGRSDQDARAGRGGGKRARLRAVGEPGVGRGVVAEPEEPATLPRSSGQGRQGSPRHRREVGGQLRRSRCSSSTRRT